VFVWKRLKLTFSFTRGRISIKFSVQKPASKTEQCVLKHFCISSTSICQNFCLLTKLGWYEEKIFILQYGTEIFVSCDGEFISAHFGVTYLMVVLNAAVIRVENHIKTNTH